MIAKIEKQSNGYVVTYERNLSHSRKDVWAMLTDNDKLALWFDELRVGKLGQDGFMNFNIGDGVFIKMEIINYKEKELLEFTWDENIVRFELYDEGLNCKLLLIEKVTKLTEHTPKDLAGWHVCLDGIATILDNNKVENRMDHWKYWFEKYSKAVASLD